MFKINRSVFQCLMLLLLAALSACGAAHATQVEGIDGVSRKNVGIGSTNGALHTYDKSGHIDSQNGAARVEQCQCDFETVAASQTDQVMGGAGAVGDYFQRLTIIPTTTSPGAVSIKDGSGPAIVVFAGGASSVADLKPIPLDLNITSTGGAWKVTSGLNETVFSAGRFTP